MRCKYFSPSDFLLRRLILKMKLIRNDCEQPSSNFKLLSHQLEFLNQLLILYETLFDFILSIVILFPFSTPFTSAS